MPQCVPQGGRPGAGSRLNVGRLLGLSRRLSRRLNAQGKSPQYEQSQSPSVSIQPEELESRFLLSSFYVSTGGNDSNSGSLARPFRTIQRAANVAGSGDTVFVRGGTYRETVRPSRSAVTGLSR